MPWSLHLRHRRGVSSRRAGRVPNQCLIASQGSTRNRRFATPTPGQKNNNREHSNNDGAHPSCTHLLDDTLQVGVCTRPKVVGSANRHEEVEGKLARLEPPPPQAGGQTGRQPRRQPRPASHGGGDSRWSESGREGGGGRLVPVEQGVAWGGAGREGWSSGVLCRHTGTVEAQRGEKCAYQWSTRWRMARESRARKCYFFMTFWRQA